MFIEKHKDMEIEEKKVVKEKLGEIILKNLFEQNHKVLHENIAYEIKCFLDDSDIPWETVNTHTPSELIDKNLVSVKIDDEEFIVGVENVI